MYQAPPPAPQDVLALTVNDLLVRWPVAVQVFLTFRLGCIGCLYSRFDTLQVVLEAQGVNEAQFVQALLKQVSSVDDVESL